MIMINSNVIVGGIYEYALKTKQSFDRILNDRDTDAIDLRGAYYLMLRRAGYTLEQINLIAGRNSISTINRSIKSAERKLVKGEKRITMYYEIAKKITVKKNEIINHDYMTNS